MKPAPTIPNPYLPPHLREVCGILALGLLRLRSRVGQGTSPAPANTGDIRLHFQAPQRRYANPNRKGIA
jgi:hypothetical protein